MAKSGKAAAKDATTKANATADHGKDQSGGDGPDSLTIEITKEAPFMVGDKSIAKLIVRPLSLAAYCACIERGAQLAPKPDQVRKYQTRERRKAQCKAYDASDRLVPMTDADVLSLPRVYAGAIQDAMALVNEGMRGEVVSKGDGIGSPVLYRFGTPLKTGTDGVTIEEVEFSAPTIGDIEDTLAQPNELHQTLSLIRNNAKPIGVDVTLIALPSWAAEAVTLADGVTIMNEVLPAFL